IQADGQHALAVRRERDAGDGHLWSLDRLEFLHAGHLPDFDYARAIGAAGSQILAVGAEGNGVDRSAMTAEVLDLFAVQRVPEPHRFVGTSRSEILAVGTEGDLIDNVGMALQLLKLLALGQAPEANGLVEAGGGEHLAIGPVGDAIDR